MSKQLLIIRHASAAWPKDIRSDFERPLKKEGIEEANNLGLFLKNNEIIPDHILCSPANRTKNTFLVINHYLNVAEDFVFFDKAIYEASYKTLFNALTKLDNKYDKVILIGHNNGISDLINYFLDENYISLPPAGIALLEFPVDNWKMISKGLAEIKLVRFPEN
ncbi:histidine phosphatase family protein [Pseudopedobacter sp.]|uniref:SixA phosphatase family protein n=1 Tax=Pseudopedobacter sp. TaxID=1936787 RepID=UPI003341C103